MDTIRIIKGSSKGKENLDNNKNISIDIEENNHLLPVNDLNGTIDEYEQYIKEKNKCGKYNIILTLNLLASNVLFNRITEVVYKEGSGECAVWSSLSGCSNDDEDSIGNIGKYKSYKGIAGTDLKRYDLIKDTAYSDANIGPLVYHCGYDIFGNHTLRHTDFSIINRLNDKSNKKTDFNTLSDEMRDFNGDNVMINVDTVGSAATEGSYTTLTGKTAVHQYMYDNIYPIESSIRNNLIESNGWFGFINPITLNIPNIVMDSGKTEIAINRCMNNNKGCEQIDMYPDRDLFSLVPKYNKYRNRPENNWDYCITYPYSSYTDNPLVEEEINGEKINGMLCELLNDANYLYGEENNETEDDWGTEYKDNLEIRFRTYLPHNLSTSDLITMDLIVADETGTTTVYHIEDIITISSIGYSGYFNDYIFGFNSSYLSDFLSGNVDESGNTTYDFINIEEDEDNIKSYSFKKGITIRFRFRKYINGCDCKYYFRLFRRVPNFKNTDVYEDGVVTEDEINENILNPINSSLNNLAFSKNIYGDDIAQIIFNDDVNVESLRDNLGRPISEIYLTLIKTNRGNEEWYDKHDYNNESIEFSHCFSKLTAGIDMLPYITTYNVHCIHNVDLEKLKGDNYKQFIEDDTEFSNDAAYNIYRELTTFEDSPHNLEENEGEITISGDTYLENIFSGTGLFFGDIVEYSPYEVKETTLTDAKYRFNTRQREYTNDSEFYDFMYEDITEDDFGLYDIDNNAKPGFTTTSVTYNTFKSDELSVIRNDDEDGKRLYTDTYAFNIAPEGYYYSPHKKIKINEYFDKVKQGNHIKMSYYENTSSASSDYYTWYIITSKNYYMNVGDKVLLYNKNTNDTINGRIISVGGENFLNLGILFDKEIDDLFGGGFALFKYNIEKPTSAQELNDGTGRYLWREMKTETDFDKDDDLFDRMFTNGKIYIHDFLNIYLFRQDKYGLYGLSYVSEDCPSVIRELEIDGEYKDVSQYESEDTEDGTICGIKVESCLSKTADKTINTTKILKKTNDYLKDFKI